MKYNKEKIKEYLDAVKTEILHLKREGISKEELNRSRDHIKAAVILGLENNVTRMRFHVNQELNLKREVTTEEIIEGINKATVDDINSLFQDFLDLDKAAVFLYGNVPDEHASNFKF